MNVQPGNRSSFGQTGFASETVTLGQLDPSEQHFRIPGPIKDLNLFLRFLPASQQPHPQARTVLYIHGMSFPSALSIAFRFDGHSWRDDLSEAGFDVWALDFYGFGLSDRY